MPPRASFLKRASTLFNQARQQGVEPGRWPPTRARYDQLEQQLNVAALLNYTLIENIMNTNVRGKAILRIQDLAVPRMQLQTLVQMEQMLTRTFQAAITELITNHALQGNDFIGVGVEGDGLKGMFVGFTVAEFNIRSIFERIRNALAQSLDSLDLGAARFVISYVRRRNGGNQRFQQPLIQVNDLLKKSCVIQIVTREDRNDCFFQCIALALVDRAENVDLWRDLTSNRTRQALREEQGEVIRSTVDVHALHDPVGTQEDELNPYEEEYKMLIHIIDARNLGFITPFKPVREGYTDTYLLFIEGVLHNPGHYHYVRTARINALFTRGVFCRLCRKAFKSGNTHKCVVAQCPACNDSECEGKLHKLKDFKEECIDCARYFFNVQCLDIHKEKRFCGKKQRCRACSLIYTGKKHRCFVRKCGNCKSDVLLGDMHHCFIQCKVIEADKTKEKKHRYIFYDYECYMSENQQHSVAMVCAIEYEHDVPHLFYNQDAFIDWVLTKQGYTFIAHNGGRYDSHFIKRSLIERGIATEDITNGNIYLSMTIGTKEKAIRFIDSFRFISSALRQFPVIFNITSVEKGHFPYRFLTKDTLNYHGPMPALEYFDFRQLKNDKDYKAALQWYEEHKHDTIDLHDLMTEYCIDDVLLLKRGCLAFQRIFMELSEDRIDPFAYVTIASVCMTLYRMKYMPVNSIQILNDMYTIELDRDRHDWLIALDREDFHIEPRLGYDGIDLENKVLFKFLGCYDYGCKRCFSAYTTHRVRCMNMFELRHAWFVERSALTEEGYTVRDIWQCQWKAQLKRDRGLAAWIASADTYITRLNPRDAFYGGRSEPTKLLVQDGCMGFFDYTSLYPSVQHGYTLHGLTDETYDEIMETFYPIGVPEVFLPPFQQPLSTYFGFMKCCIVPPRKLYHPVLPTRLHEKLFFCLCHTCATEYNTSGECLHTDEERALFGTWTTVEIQVALRYGYTLLQVYEIWHYPHKSSALFRSYVEQFLVFKQQAKGRKALLEESQCDTIEEYIAMYLEETGLQLDLAQIPDDENTGLYQISKLCLNSLWGKFGQRDNQGTTVDVFNRTALEDIVFNDRYEINGMFIPTSSATTLNYSLRDDCVQSSFNTNVVVCAFTTAYARLRLYQCLDVIGERLCYSDTDSVIFLNDPPVHIKTGNTLGDLKNELAHTDYITDFVSTGSKSYAYKTTMAKDKLKIKGITLNMKTKDVLDFNVLQDLVLQDDDEEPNEIEVTNMRFHIESRQYIKTIQQNKRFRKTFDKRYPVLMQDGIIDTLPYGY